MSTETTTPKKIAELAFVALAVLFAFGGLFWNELLDWIGDSLNTSKTVVETKIDDDQFKLRRNGFELRPLRNDIELVSVSELSASMPTSAGVPVSFVLTSVGGANDFPSLRVFLTSSGGRRLRWIDYRPSDYAHDMRFESQRVELLLTRQPGESGFTVEPFYGTNP